jgi:hypothetical protein
MKKMYSTVKYFTISIISICIILNLILCFNEESFKAIFSLRNLYLYAFLICFLFYNRITLIILIMIVGLFWYQFFTESKLIEHHTNPIIYFTNPLMELLKFYVNNFVKNSILIIPLFLNFVMTIIEIPYRLKTEINKK